VTVTIRRATLAAEGQRVSSQYLGARAGLAPAQAGNRKGLPLLFEKIRQRYAILFSERETAMIADIAIVDAYLTLVACDIVIEDEKRLRNPPTEGNEPSA